MGKAVEKRRWAALGSCIVLLATHVAAQDAPPPGVIVTAVTQKDVTPHFSYVGRVEAVDSVALLARVEGFLEERKFKEGRTVKAGDVLFQIEKAPYEIVVAQRRADLAGAEASLDKARADLARNRELRDKRVVAAADLDVAEADEATASASVLQAKAALERAELDLSYTTITTPIDGQIGRAQYSLGNLVGPNSEALATVTRMDPVYVVIAVSNKDLIDARREGLDLDNPTVTPSLQLADGTEYEHPGQFDFLDTQVDQSTDTVQARAVFANPDRILVPGQFVSVVVKQKDPVHALAIPQSAVQEDSQGYFVLVVDDDNRVQARRIVVGKQVGTDWSVTSGLARGENVIVQGVQKVRPDMTVTPRTESP